jgi:hypothetical protein
MSTSGRRAGRFLMLAAAGAAPLAAQHEVAHSTRLQGVVFDSLFTRRPLADAQIWVEGTDQFTRSDARGRFALNAVPSGRYRVVAWHPAFDSAGFSAPMRLVDLTGLPSAFLTLATPAATTVYARQCPGTRPRASGVLLGSVRDADGATLPPGVRLEARWVEFDIGRTGGQADRVAQALTDQEGRFRLCGVPNDVAVAVTAIAPDARSAGPIEVHLRQREVGTQRIEVAPPVSVPGTGAVLQGRVLSNEGRPLAGAEVRTLDHRLATRTDPSGNFALSDLTGGSHTVEIRAIGFAPRREQATLRTGERRYLDAVLVRTAVALPEIAVTGRAPSPLDLSGFELRKRGGRGYFLDDEAIRKRRAVTTSDLFVGIPGVEVTATGGAGIVLFRRAEGQIGKFNRGSCLPQYFVDGVARQVGSEDAVSGEFNPIGQVIGEVGLLQLDVGPGQLVRIEDLAGIEVYRGTADAPPQFSKLDAGCGVIVMWTRRGKPTAWYREQDAPPTDPLPERNSP